MNKLLWVLSSAILGMPLGAALAHHSGAAFDRGQEATIEGEVKEWNWANPHSWLQIYAPHDGEEGVVWSFESTATTILLRQGYRRTSMQPGDKITVGYNPFKDGAPGGNLVRVTLPDGTVLGRLPPPESD